jgi:phage gp36-like protein
MAYCTQVDIERKVGAARVAQWADNGSGGVDTAVVTAAIAWGDTQINAALAQRFSDFLPFTTPPPMVFQIAVTFAMFSLACRMQETGELWQAQYDEARELLQMLADAKIDLIAADGTNLTEQGTYAPVTFHSPRMTDETGVVMPTELAAWQTRHVSYPSR